MSDNLILYRLTCNIMGSGMNLVLYSRKSANHINVLPRWKAFYFAYHCSKYVDIMHRIFGMDPELHFHFLTLWQLHLLEYRIITFIHYIFSSIFYIHGMAFSILIFHTRQNTEICMEYTIVSKCF